MKLAHPNVISFWRRLSLWSLAAPPSELQTAWLYLGNEAHKQGFRAPARRILSMVGTSNVPGDRVKYCALKYDWAEAETTEKGLEIIEAMVSHTLELCEAIGFPPGVLIHYERLIFPNPALASSASKLQKRRLSRCLYRLSKWDKRIRGDGWVEVRRLRRTHEQPS